MDKPVTWKVDLLGYGTDNLLHLADSIQMATAIRKKASFFLTNDTSLPSLPSLQTLVLNDLLKDLGDLKEVSDDQQKDS